MILDVARILLFGRWWCGVTRVVLIWRFVCWAGVSENGGLGRCGGMLVRLAARLLLIMLFFFCRVVEGGSGYSITNLLVAWALGVWLLG